MLSKPIRDLLAQVYEEKRIQGLTKQFSSDDGTSTTLAHDAPTSTAGMGIHPHGCDADVQHDLWVDKYSPRSFSQLLSPEKINREVPIILMNERNVVDIGSIMIYP